MSKNVKRETQEVNRKSFNDSPFTFHESSIIRRYLRISAPRELYTIEQAAFRLNISRNELSKELIKKGTLKVLFRNGRQFVTDQSIKEFIQFRSMRYKA